MTKRVLWFVVFALVATAIYLIDPAFAQSSANFQRDRIKCEMTTGKDTGNLFVIKRNGALYIDDEFEVFHMEYTELDDGVPVVVLFFRNEKIFKNNTDRFFGLAMRKDGVSALLIFDINTGIVGDPAATGTCFEG